MEGITFILTASWRAISNFWYNQLKKVILESIIITRKLSTWIMSWSWVFDFCFQNKSSLYSGKHKWKEFCTRVSSERCLTWNYHQSETTMTWGRILASSVLEFTIIVPKITNSSDRHHSLLIGYDYCYWITQFFIIFIKLYFLRTNRIKPAAEKFTIQKNWKGNKTERESSAGKNYKLILLHVHCLLFLLLQTFHLSILCTTAENCFLCICFYAVMKIYGMCLTYFLPPISYHYFLFIFLHIHRIMFL